MIKKRYWFTAWSIAISLHAAALTLVLQTDAPQGDALDNGENGVDVGLGTLGSYADVSERLAPPKTETTPPVPEKPAAKPKPVLTKPAPEQAAVVLSKKEPEPTPEPMQQPQPTVEPSDEVEPETQPAPEQPVADVQQQATDADSQQASAAMTKGSGSADEQRAGGKKGNGKHYINDLMRWLAQHRRYPVEAKKAKQQGTVYLQFLITRDGAVQNYKIYKSSGHELLDRSALEMIVRATPLPAVPDDFYPGRSELPLVIPIEFSLITNTSFKD